MRVYRSGVDAEANHNVTRRHCHRQWLCYMLFVCIGPHCIHRVTWGQ